MTDRIRDYVEGRAGDYDDLARDIWEHPERSGEEERSAALHRDRLTVSGFRITDFPEMPHAFSAERGAGKPVIALMGEYDALPGLSQACSTRREPRSRAPRAMPAGTTSWGSGPWPPRRPWRTPSRPRGFRARFGTTAAPQRRPWGGSPRSRRDASTTPTRP